MKKEITIVPIFNQAAPKIWEDFLRIRTETRRKIYNIETCPQEQNIAMLLFQSSWEKPSKNFAFGAYDNDNMIGFISGTFDTHLATIQHLYVLPQYQGLHIGAQLLSSAESAISVDRNNVELVSMTKAEAFYKKYGYISYRETNRYNKSVKNCGHCQVAPVFRCSAAIIRKMTELSGQPTENFNKNALNKSRSPIFIYRDNKSQITAFGICSDKTEIYSTSPCAKLRIEKAIAKYNSKIR
ncbi:MAG: GNAT family N-acetyltransferase [Alphaproteobacteria bacterium]|nr:GNAT family N-acetyltransferase [Alphaproteobacteria bacterium]